MEFDLALRGAGSFGLYQKLLLICLVVPSGVICAFVYFCQYFIILVPQNYHCALPAAVFAANLSIEEGKRLFIPQAADGSYERCLIRRYTDDDAVVYAAVAARREKQQKAATFSRRSAATDNDCVGSSITDSCLQFRLRAVKGTSAVHGVTIQGTKVRPRRLSTGFGKKEAFQAANSDDWRLASADQISRSSIPSSYRAGISVTGSDDQASKDGQTELILGNRGRRVFVRDQSAPSGERTSDKAGVTSSGGSIDDYRFIRNVSCLSYKFYFGGEDGDTENLYPTIVTDLGLVCDRAKYVYVIQTLFYVASSLGTIIFGVVSDRFGRRSSIVCSYLLAATAGLLCSMVDVGLTSFILFRFLVGLCLLPLSEDAYVLAVEYIGAERRSLAILAWAVAYISGSMTVPWLARACRSWRLLNAVVSVPLLLPVVLMNAIPESARWLLSKGRDADAVGELMAVGRWNGRTVPANLELKMDDEDVDCGVLNAVYVDGCLTPGSEGGCRRPSASVGRIRLRRGGGTLTFLSAFLGTPVLRTRTALLATSWFLTYLIYHSMVFSASFIGADVYLSYTLGAAVELMALVVVGLSLECIGRKWPMLTAATVVAIAGLCGLFFAGSWSNSRISMTETGQAAVVSVGNHESSAFPSAVSSSRVLRSAKVTLLATSVPSERTLHSNDAVAGDLDYDTRARLMLLSLMRVAITAHYDVMLQYGAEVYPTILRGRGLAVLRFAGTLSLYISPALVSTAQINSVYPIVICGLLGVPLVVVGLFLPETRGRPLPQTLEDAEKLGRGDPLLPGCSCSSCVCFSSSSSSSSASKSKQCMSASNNDDADADRPNGSSGDSDPSSGRRRRELDALEVDDVFSYEGDANAGESIPVKELVGSCQGRKDDVDRRPADGNGAKMESAEGVSDDEHLEEELDGGIRALVCHS